MAFGDIVVGLAVDKRQFDRQMQATREEFTKVRVDAQRMNVALSQVGTRTGGFAAVQRGSGNATFALLELSRAAEDAASQFSTQGLAGAIRASANNFATLATIINPMAGVVVGLGAALATILIPRLMETGNAAEQAAEKAKKFADRLEEMRRIGREGRNRFLLFQGIEEELAFGRGAEQGASERLAFGRRFSGSEATQRGLVQELTTNRDRLRADRDIVNKAIGQLVGEMQSFAAIGATPLADTEKQLTEASKKRDQIARQLQNAEIQLLLAQDSLAESVRRRVQIEQAASGVLRQEHALKQDDLFFAPGRRELARIAGLEEQSIDAAARQGLLAGISQRLATLRKQRDDAGRIGVSFNRPELATRGNAVDRIVDIANSKREQAQEAHRKKIEEAHSKEIELLEKLYEEVKNTEGNGLKPARLG